MQWNNQNATSSPGGKGVAPTRTQSMKLIDDAGNVIAQFNRAYNGTITFTVNGESFVSADAASVTLDAAEILLPNLPTSDPQVAGALWSDGGVVTVSAGA